MWHAYHWPTFLQISHYHRNWLLHDSQSGQTDPGSYVACAAGIEEARWSNGKSTKIYNAKMTDCRLHSNAFAYRLYWRFQSCCTTFYLVSATIQAAVRISKFFPFTQGITYVEIPVLPLPIMTLCKFNSVLPSCLAMMFWSYISLAKTGRYLPWFTINFWVRHKLETTTNPIRFSWEM